MTVEKGLDEDVADKIGKWVVHSGKRDLLEKMQKDEELSANPRMQEGLADIDLLFTYLENFDAMDSVSFDLSLARGLDCEKPCRVPGYGRILVAVRKLIVVRLYWRDLRGRYRRLGAHSCRWKRQEAAQEEGWQIWRRRRGPI